MQKSHIVRKYPLVEVVKLFQIPSGYQPVRNDTKQQHGALFTGKVVQKLKEAMANIHRKCADNAEEFGDKTNLTLGPADLSHG